MTAAELNYLPREVLLFLLLREKDQAALSEYKFNFRKMWLYEMDPIFLGSNSCWEGSGLSLSCVGRSSSTKWLWIHVAEDGSLQQHHYPYQDQQSWFLSLKLKPESNSSHKLCNRFSSRAKPENYWRCMSMCELCLLGSRGKTLLLLENLQLQSLFHAN